MSRQWAAALLASTLLLGGVPHAFPSPQFRSRALAVRVDVLVTEGRKPVAGLTAADFELRDNGVVQAVEIVDAADVPLNVVLALDTSASTDGPRQAALAAAGQVVLDGLAPRDRAALITFSQAVTPAVPLTSDLRSVRQALLNIKPTGRTAVMDAVYVALTATLAQPGRSLVVACTDGADISSWLDVAEVMEAAKRSSAAVYSVTTGDAPRLPALESVTAATGGDRLRVTSSSDLRDAFQAILREFRSRYVLAFTPTGVPAGGYHELDVKVRRRGADVKARRGYIGLEAR